MGLIGGTDSWIGTDTAAEYTQLNYESHVKIGARTHR